MKGMDYVIKARKDGFKPVIVTIGSSPYDQELTPSWLQYEASDVPELIDLRPLVGTFVAVMGDDEVAARWARAVCRAGADTVITVHPIDGGRTFRVSGVDL